MMRAPSRLLLPALLALVAACARGESADPPEGTSDAEAAEAAETPRASGAAVVAEPGSITLGGGTSIVAALDGVISSRTGAAGDAFTATVSRDVLLSGRVAIPMGSTVRGTVTEVRAAPDDRSVGALTLAVSSLTVRGREYPMSASLDSLMTVQEGRGLERADVIRVAGGAAAGSIIGQAVGKDTKATIIGGVIGAATGAAVSVLVKDQDIVLPAGARLMLTLREPLEVGAP